MGTLGIEYGYGGGGGAAASTSTIKLPLDSSQRGSWEEPHEGDQSRKTIRVRHSDEVSSLSGIGGEDSRSFEFSASEEDERKRVPKIRIGGERDSEDRSDDEDDRWLNEEHEVGGNAHQGGGGDQAGVILG